jgi:hypothetical protein
MREQEKEELFQIYVRMNRDIGVSPKEVPGLKRELRDRLRKIWDAEPRPISLIFDDFWRDVMDQFLDRLRKQDPQFRRPR